MKTFARLLALVLAFQILAPTPKVLAAVTEVPLTLTVGAPRSNPLNNTVDVLVTVKNDLGYVVPGPIALGSFGDPFPPEHPAPGQFQPYLIGKPGPIYPDGASAPFPSYVDFPRGLAPGQSATQVLRFHNGHNVIADLGDVRAYAYSFPPYYGVPVSATTFPTTGYPLDPATGAPIEVSSPLPPEQRVWRTAAWRNQLFQYDADARNYHGGMLMYQLVPIPNPLPAYAGAMFPDTARIDAQGVVRWSPSNLGVHAFRIVLDDGFYPGHQDIIVDVIDPATQVAADPISCNGGSYVLPVGQQYVEGQYDALQPNDPFVVGRANVVLANGRKMSCTPAKFYPIGVGNHRYTCRTSDGLSPADTCSFDVAVTEPSPPPVPEPPDLRLEVYGEEKFQHCQAHGPYGLLGFTCERYLQNTITDRGSFQVQVSNEGGQPVQGVVLEFAIPVTQAEGDPIDDEAWAFVPGREGDCTLDALDNMLCAFGDLAPGERFDVHIIFQPGNEEALVSHVGVSSSSIDSDPNNNQAPLFVVEKAGPIEFGESPPPKQQCEFREDVARISFGVIWESFRCVGEEMPWVTWFVSGVFAALSIATIGGGIVLASQTALGGALRASWVFHAHEVVTLAR